MAKNKGIGHGEFYTTEEVDAALAQVAAGGAAGGFSDTAPLTYSSDPVNAQSDGQVIGLSADGQTFHQPVIVAAVPIKVNGVEYLIPLVER
jgi:hypothetical protein